MGRPKHTTWLWPDHVISKRESGELREQHNATVNSHAELLALLERSMGWLLQSDVGYLIRQELGESSDYNDLVRSVHAARANAGAV
jgi:hypothetical protein